MRQIQRRLAAALAAGAPGRPPLETTPAGQPVRGH
jgi:hypothetical protein